jgi:NAD+ kinase
MTTRIRPIGNRNLRDVLRLGSRDSVDVGIDGIESGTLAPGEEVVVGFRDNLALLAQLEGETFYRRIREKFGRLAH